MHFLCDKRHRIPEEFGRSCSLVLGKSFKTVLDEVDFIVSLYSFCLLTVPRVNHSFPQVSYLLPSLVNQFPKLPSSRHISNSFDVFFFSSEL